MAPAAVCPIGKCTDHRIIDCIYQTRNKSMVPAVLGGESEDIRVKEHQKRYLRLEDEVRGGIAEAVGEFFARRKLVTVNGHNCGEFGLPRLWLFRGQRGGFVDNCRNEGYSKLRNSYLPSLRQIFAYDYDPTSRPKGWRFDCHCFASRKRQPGRRARA